MPHIVQHTHHATTHLCTPLYPEHPTVPWYTRLYLVQNYTLYGSTVYFFNTVLGAGGQIGHCT